MQFFWILCKADVFIVSSHEMIRVYGIYQPIALSGIERFNTTHFFLLFMKKQLYDAYH